MSGHVLRPAGSSHLTAARRDRELAALAHEEVDVLVVGGGVTGCGVALDAASRGLSVALVERADLAHGTSRWSSKLVHGGLRYLATGDVGIAWESCRERGVLLEHTAPHLVRPLPFVVAFGDDLPRREAVKVWAGVRLLDAMRVAAGTSRRTLPSPRLLSRPEVVRLAPAVRRLGLRGGLQYWDGGLEDDARLVVALARTAAAHGARVLTRVGATALRGDGADLRDELTGHRLAVRARSVVACTGVWAGELSPEVRLRPSRGVHLVLPAARLGHPQAALTAPVAGSPGRYVLAVPAPDGRVHVGLTDTPAPGPLPDVPLAEASDVDTLLSWLSAALDAPLDRADVLGTFAGLRPLLPGPDGTGRGGGGDGPDGRDTRDLSRGHAVVESASGALTVTGGKLTTYRAMAQDAVDRLVARDGLHAGDCRTARLPLVGAAPPEALDGVRAPRRLVARYGTEAPAVAALAADDPTLAEPLAPGLRVTGAEVVAAVAWEGALQAEDVLGRRTRLGLVATDADAARPRVQELVARATARVRART